MLADCIVDNGGDPAAVSGSLLLHQKARWADNDPKIIRVAGRLDNLDAGVRRLDSSEESNTWSLQLFDDNACVGSTVGDPVALDDLESGMEGQTVLTGRFPDSSTVLSTLGGQSVSILSDAGQAACCEITNVKDNGPERRLEDNPSDEF